MQIPAGLLDKLPHLYFRGRPAARLQGENNPEQLAAYIPYEILSIIIAIILIAVSIRSFIIVRKHERFLVCYAIIGIVFLSNFVFLIEQGLIALND